MHTQKNIPIDVVHLLPVLDAKLIELLKSLGPADWNRQTIAKQWRVKDVAAHLLDGNIRLLSIFRDDFFGENTSATSARELVNFLNGLNADWVKAMKRVSVEMLIFLLEATGPLFCNYLKSLDPLEKSVFPVNWAGETESSNRMEIAREYTEKWLHQQQIRDAVNKPGLMTKELFYPFIDIFMLALPYTYRNEGRPNGTSLEFTIPTDIGGSWYLVKNEDAWHLQKTEIKDPTSQLIIDADSAWKLFSKSLSPSDVKDKVVIHGDTGIASIALSMVSVMA
jgi:uncharacterized protein (TIGR03083 family)